MTDVTIAAQAGYRGDSDQRPAYLSSPNGCAYVAGMAHRIAGGRFPVKATSGRGYHVTIGGRTYDTMGGICEEARITIASSRWAEAQ